MSYFCDFTSLKKKKFALHFSQELAVGSFLFICPKTTVKKATGSECVCFCVCLWLNSTSPDSSSSRYSLFPSLCFLELKNISPPVSCQLKGTNCSTGCISVPCCRRQVEVKINSILNPKVQCLNPASEPLWIRAKSSPWLSPTELPGLQQLSAILCLPAATHPTKTTLCKAPLLNVDLKFKHQVCEWCFNWVQLYLSACPLMHLFAQLCIFYLAFSLYFNL